MSLTSTATATKRQSKLYVLHEDELVSNSPYTIEGTETVLDIPAVRNLPWHYPDALFEGVVREIRYIRSCASIFVDEQIKMGFPLDRKPTIDEINDLGIKNGQILASRANLMQYIDSLPINYSSPFRLPTSRNFIRESDPKADLKMSFESQQSKAQYYALCFSISDTRAKDLIRLRYVNYPVNEIMAVRIELGRIVMEEPDGVAFMMKHLKDDSEDTAMILLASKAKELDLISFNILPGQVAFKENGNWQPMVKISDNGGQPVQFNRLVEWLKTSDGAMYAELLKGKVNQALPDEEATEDEQKLIDGILAQQATATVPTEKLTAAKSDKPDITSPAANVQNKATGSAENK